MATILMTWELGAGYGHVTSLAAAAKPLIERGHQVVGVVRDLIRARTAFADLKVELIQAPIKVELSVVSVTWTYASILQTNGFASPHELSALADPWRRIIQRIRPDLILFDHSPTALLASRGLSCRRAAFGTGFYCPPMTSPLPNLRRWEKPEQEQIAADQKTVTHCANQVLESWGEKELASVGELFASLDDRFFLTLPALDCYGPRDDAVYLGPPPLGDGVSPTWPDGTGKKIFAYLKPFKAIDALFSRIQQMGNPTLVYAPELSKDKQQALECPTIRFSSRRLNMQEALDSCDAVVLNGTNAATCDALVAGKPTLHIPQVLEQVLNALAVQDLGAGLIARADFDQEVDRHIQALINGETFSEAARDFVHTWQPIADPVSIIADRIESMMG